MAQALLPGAQIAEPNEAEVRAGLIVWGIAIVFIAGTELAAVFGAAPWPTISATTGHLEDKWTWFALIVVFLVVYGAYCVFPRGDHAPGDMTVSPIDGRALTASGRRVKPASGTKGNGGDREEDIADRLGNWYPFVAVLVTIAAIVLAATRQGGSGEAPFIGAYVLYGTIALAWVIVPSLLAYFFAKDVNFPTFVWTLHVLYHRWRFLALILLAALTILLIHLALYPWPSIIHDLQRHGPSKQAP